MQTEQSGVAGSVEQAQIRELPLNGRDSIQMVSLTPGMRYLGLGGNTDTRTVQGLGMRTDQTLFTVDGQDHNDPSTENGIIIPTLDSVAQFRVETSNYSAASGRQPLQVKLITKGGTNEFHGTLFELVRNDMFDARNTFALTRPKLRRNQFGGSAGGPIKKDKVFFFTSLEDDLYTHHLGQAASPEVVDADGRVLQHSDLFVNQVTVGTIKTRAGSTPYSSFGDWVLLVCVLGLLGAAVVARRRSGPKAPP